MRRALALPAAVGVLALAWWAAPPSQDRHAPGPAPAPPVPAVLDAALPSGGRDAPAASAPSIAPLPESLRGTEPDGGLPVDEHGRFVEGPDALAFFEYFHAALGEESAAAVADRIRREIVRRLPPDAARDALAFFERYLAYREGARRLAEDETAATDLAARLRALHELRVATFGAETAERLFGAEEARVRATLARREVLADGALTKDERADRLAAIDAALPPEVRAPYERMDDVVALRRDEAALAAAGAGADEIHALRTERFGAEAAERLATLDRRRAAWAARVDAYRAERARLETDRRLAPSERAAAIDALLATSFTATERRRVEAQDRVAAELGR